MKHFSILGLISIFIFIFYSCGNVVDNNINKSDSVSQSIKKFKINYEKFNQKNMGKNLPDWILLNKADYFTQLQTLNKYHIYLFSKYTDTLNVRKEQMYLLTLSANNELIDFIKCPIIESTPLLHTHYQFDSLANNLICRILHETEYSDSIPSKALNIDEIFEYYYININGELVLSYTIEESFESYINDFKNKNVPKIEEYVIDINKKVSTLDLKVIDNNSTNIKQYSYNSDIVKTLIINNHEEYIFYFKNNLPVKAISKKEDLNYYFNKLGLVLIKQKNGLIVDYLSNEFESYEKKIITLYQKYCISYLL